MSAPRIDGIHHFTIPVSNLESSAAWFNRVLNAEWDHDLDHKDNGVVFEIILRMNGLGCPIALVHAPRAAAAIVGYYPISFSVEECVTLQAWADHLGTVGVQHSELIKGFSGDLIEFTTPDGLQLRLYTKPAGGFQRVKLRSEGVDVHSPALNKGIMRS